MRCRHQSKIRLRRQEWEFGVLSRGYEDKEYREKEIVEQDRISQSQKYTQPTFSFDFGDSKVNV